MNTTTYFDPSALSAAQRSRWPGAVLEYESTLKRNRSLGVAPTHTLKAGDPHSALFFRLLNGQNALDHPPPTRDGQPWHAVIEERGPFVITPTITFFEGAPMGGAHLSLAGCPWDIVTANPAARDLIELQRQLSAWETDGWSAAFLDRVLDAYGRQPELIIRHGCWTTYRLALSRRSDALLRGEAIDRVAQITARLTSVMDGCRSVFECGRFLLNLDIGTAVVLGRHPAAMSNTASTDRVRAAAAIAEYEANPARFDQVLVRYDHWSVERVRLDAPFDTADVQALNEYQTRIGSVRAGHLLTCPNHGDTRHGGTAADFNLLIATRDGWVCPHCSYRQDWAPSAFTRRGDDPALIAGPHGQMLAATQLRRIEHALAHYERLRAKGAAGADVMVRCLRHRASELQRVPERQAGHAFA